LLTVPLTRRRTKAASPVPVQRRAGVRQVQGGQQGREVHLSAQVAHSTLGGKHAQRGGDGHVVIKHLNASQQREFGRYAICMYQCTLSRLQGADPLPPSSTCSEDRYKSFERGIYPPLPHWDRREILAKPYQFRTCSALAPM
jgi:hypothetical protein